MGKLRVGILISGGGSNMLAIVKACQAPDFPVEVAVVISNRPEAKGIEAANSRGINTTIVDHKLFADRPAFEAVLNQELQKHDVELVCNAGFMRILTAEFVNKWLGKQINIHPALLPSYKGLHCHERALNDGVKITGCTVHYVCLEVDAGAIIAQAAVPVLEGDDPTILAARVLKAEHKLYPHALRMVADGRAVEANNIVTISTNTEAANSLFVPKI
jgi:phosphoribosylglycinamide formyltransferase-1